MEIPIVPIGNSKGIRLSKTLIEKYNLKDKVELVMEKEYIILKPILKARAGWDSAFKQMQINADDNLLFDDVFNDEDPEEWI